MTNDEVSNLAVNALMDKIADMVGKGKPNTGLTEDEHAIAMTNVVVEVISAMPVGVGHDAAETKRALAVAIRATKNGSQMRQIAEKRGILKATVKGDKTADVFAQYA